METSAQSPRLLLVGHRWRDLVDRTGTANGLCFSVDSISEARLALSRDDFDLLLVDASAVNAPVDAAAAIRMEFPELRVILLEADEAARQLAREAGIDAVDPSRRALLAKRIGAASARRREGFAASRNAAIAMQNSAYKLLLEAFATPRSRDEMAKVAATVAQRVLTAEGAAVGRIVGNQIECCGASGQMGPFRGESMPRLDAFTEALGPGGRAIRVGEQQKFSQTLQDLSKVTGIASAAVAPIRSRDVVIGMLAVTSSKAESFTDADLRSIQGVADLVGIGLSLADAEDLRASFLRDLVAGIEDERRRLARDLHDEAGQLLTALLVNLHALEKQLPAAPDSPLLVAQQLASRTLVELQRIARGLRPAVITELSFEQALRRLADEHHRTHGTRIDVACNGLLSPPELPTDVQVALYRIAQETLTNIARHASATTVGIIARRAEGRIRLIIEDDGKGMDPASHASGAGLRNIRERTELLGGEFTLESTAGVGTAVYVEIPLGGTDAENHGAGG